MCHSVCPASLACSQLHLPQAKHGRLLTARQKYLYRPTVGTIGCDRDKNKKTEENLQIQKKLWESCRKTTTKKFCYNCLNCLLHKIVHLKGVKIRQHKKPFRCMFPIQQEIWPVVWPLWKEKNDPKMTHRQKRKCQTRREKKSQNKNSV